MKKYFLSTFLFLTIFTGLIIPAISLAGEYKTASGHSVCYEGLVPCGKEVYVDGIWQDGKCVGGTPTVVSCQFCHFFVMINNTVQFITFRFIPVVAVLMFVIGGAMFFFGGANAKLLGQAKGILTSTAIGIIIIFSAWVIVNTILTNIGIIDTPSILEWYKVGCEIK